MCCPTLPPGPTHPCGCQCSDPADDSAPFATVTGNTMFNLNERKLAAVGHLATVRPDGLKERYNY